ncbi:23S rRNA pseudouridine955/2504/2580 synthase [Azospirillum fermentarium]|uniref:RluA family pseudouridine synthase n=1 Tax=Azospirillum fermentarium TaxID=1233114 RepID=UPI0022261FF3|nr:RluA family pseudouridine synthase [Azospirillum fermentarium]MCW2246791.1 23S rRNA pseudouridine955/2504/2580 synthase [Azospirillum fermentarium]
MSAVETRNVAPDEADIRLDRWFKRHFPEVGHGHLQKLLRTGQVRVDGKRADASTRLAAGQAIRIPPLTAPTPSPDSPPKPKPALSAAAKREAEALVGRVLYRDDDVIAIDKPAGLAVQGGTGMTKHLDAMLDSLRFGSAERPRLVHRLDKDTSGVLLLARNAFAATRLAESFRGRDARKIYWAATVGVPRPFQGKIDLALAKEGGPHGERVAANEEDGKRALTYFSVLENLGKTAAFVALWPRTGRTHQLRVHMAAIGTPILGDGKYGGAEAFLPGAEVPKKLHLHARRLILPHPRGGHRTIDVTAPIPEHMAATWRYLGFSANLREDPFAEVE